MKQREAYNDFQCYFRYSYAFDGKRERLREILHNILQYSAMRRYLELLNVGLKCRRREQYLMEFRIIGIVE